MKRGRKTVSGTHKAVLELASAMRKEIGVDDTDLEQIREDQIKQRIDVLQGGQIAYRILDSPEKHSICSSLKTWSKRELHYIVHATGSTLITATAWMIPYGTLISIWMSGLSCGLIVALSFGSSKKSRLFFVLFFGTLSSIAVLILLICLHPWSLNGIYGSKAETRLLEPF